MDLSVAPNCAQAVAILPSSIFPTFNSSKRLAGSPKELKLIPTCPTLTVQGSTRILIYMDGLLSVAPNCAQAAMLSYLFHIPERSIALVKRLAGSPKGAEIDPNLPHANKSVTPR
jgi:hypothetical protein